MNLKKENDKTYTFVETFVGAGGSHYGFKNAGFTTVYAADNTEEMMQSLRHNNPEIPKDVAVTEDIKDTDGKRILEITNLKKGDLDVLMGGIVCCGFSLAGVRDPTDSRNRFYKEQLRLVKQLKPKISVIENVPAMQSMIIADEGVDEIKKERISEIFKKLKDYNGLKSSKTKNMQEFSRNELQHIKDLKEERDALLLELQKNSIKVFDDIQRIYKELGYKTHIKKLNAANYGAATKRERIFIVAVREDLKINFNWPEKTHGENIQKEISDFDPDSIKPFVTVKDALDSLDLEGLNNPNKDLDNQPMNHNEKSVRRFKCIPEGKNIVSVIDELPPELKISKFYSRGCTMRLARNTAAPTLVPGHSNFPVHPIEHRSITVREAATITGFPLDYKFFGSHTSRCLQVGNAIPVKLAEAVAKAVKKSLDQIKKD